MSATIYWVKTQPDENAVLSVNAPQSFMGIMEETFGERLPSLNKDDLLILNAMFRTANDNYTTPLNQLIEAITKYGEIELKATY